LLLANSALEAQKVWANGNDVRLFIHHPDYAEEWHALVDGKLGPEVEAPAFYQSPSPPQAKDLGFPTTDNFWLHFHKAGKQFVVTGREFAYKDGTWLCEEGKTPVKIY